MKLLVTGASGFLGQHLCASLRERHDIVALYARHRPALAGVEWRQYVHGEHHMNRLPDDIEGTVHLAQSDRYRDFPAGAEDMYTVNVDYVFRLLEHARRCDVRVFLGASTGGVYEGIDAPLRENAAVRPANFYAASKWVGEILCQPYRPFFPVTLLRLFFLYGPGQVERLVPNLTARIRRGEAIDVVGSNGGLRITPTYVDDVVDVIETALMQSWDGTFNVASPESMTIEDLACQIGEAIGRHPVFQRTGGADPPAMVPDLSALCARYDMSRFRPFSAVKRAILAGE